MTAPDPALKAAVEREIERMREIAADWRRPALAQVEGPNDLKIYGATIADDIDRWADMLSLRRAPVDPEAFEAVQNYLTVTRRSDDWIVAENSVDGEFYSFTNADLRTLLAALSSQASVMEQVDLALGPVLRAVIMTGGGRLLKQPTLRYIDALESRLQRARTALSRYRTLGGE